MPNRNLTEVELKKAWKLIESVRKRLGTLAGGDSELLFALRRKVYKELTYDERGKPAFRNKLKASKREEQGNICPLCGKKLPIKDSILDRFNAADGYTPENTRLIHRKCDEEVQSTRGYA